MKCKRMHLLCAVLALSSMPANAATKITTDVEGRKGSTVVTPINDTIEDVMRAAADADGVAARTNTILDLEAHPIVVDLAGFPAAPLATNAVVSPIAPIAVGAKESLLPYFSIAGLLLVPLLFGGGDGDGSSTPGQPLPPGGPSGPGSGPPPGPVPAVPEPATWLMMLLGFGAVGTMLRAAPRRSRRERASA